MQLLDSTIAQSKKKLENDALVDSNVRLRKYYSTIVQKLNTVKESYEPDKLQKIKEFENFCKELQGKRETLLKELSQWQTLLAETKETYYGMIAKQDELQEIRYKIDEENKKLDLRQTFVEDLEERFKLKNNI